MAPSCFVKLCENFDSKRSKHATSAASWYRALLGSIKAACSLEDVLKTLPVKVTVVVTMCANEMKIQVNLTMWTVELSAADGH